MDSQAAARNRAAGIDPPMIFWKMLVKARSIW